jgi:hypothetical protein
MDINDILKAEREGNLSGYGMVELREMRRICVLHVQKNDWFASGVIKSVEEEIRRKESNEAESRALQRHQETIAGQERLKTTIGSLAKPHWVIWATFIAGAIAALASVILLFR